MQKKVLCLGLATLVSGGVCAGERIQINGNYGAIDKSQILELGANHVLILNSSEGTGYMLSGPNADNPMQHSAGPCSGMVELKDGKAVIGQGYCVRTNPQGGKWLVKWGVPPGTDGSSGTWTISGIEGNTVGWKGEGTWGPVIVTGKDRYLNPFKGWLEKP
ncbi:MAG: hypothetical protein IT532_10265 [Burkholderiales bacterium]|nr:hypothetical protein [Burkholderiales bacterium]